MRKMSLCIRSRLVLCLGTAALGAGLLPTRQATAQSLPASQTERPSTVGRGNQPPTLNQAQELAMKIKAPFTLVAVGDIIELHPISQLSRSDVQGVFKIVRGADVSFGNMEANMIDLQHYQGPISDHTGSKDVASDIKAMGFKILNRANNHTTDMGIEGMNSTNHWLEEAGLVFAGAGRNLTDAREARFIDTPKGRVGLVGMFSTTSAPGSPFRSGSSPDSAAGQAATYGIGNAGGLPGVNALHLTQYQVLTPEVIDNLRKIRDAVYEHRTEVRNPVPNPIPQRQPNEPEGRLEFFGTWFKAGATPGSLSYTANPDDLRDILKSVRTGKQYSDFMIVTIHTHEAGEYPSDSYAPDFLIELAHKAIDNGADVFVGHGVHVLRGVEIYNGKPIFYGLNSFVYGLEEGTIGFGRYRADKIDPYSAEETDAEMNFKSWERAGSGPTRDNMESVVAECRYEGGELKEVLLHPIELGYGGPVSEKGIPRIASPDAAHRILQELQTISKPFGTNILIEGDIGVIRVSRVNHSS